MSDQNQNDKNQILEGEKALLLDHNYDGIQELDHVLPRWWIWIFYGTIIFAAWYSGYYLSGHGPTPQEELAVAMKEIEALRPASSNEKDLAGIAAMVAALKNPESLKNGAQVYATKCFPCHGDKGQGVVGPNLTDDFWVHGSGNLADISKVIVTGVAEKGMPPWGELLSSEEIANVTAFVRSIRGSMPAGGKPPQGEKQDSKDE